MRRSVYSFIILLAAFAVTLAQSQGEGVIKLQGTIVCCADCWAEADRKTVAYGTEEDIEKAAQCIANGDPTLLAVENEEGGWTLYQLEPGKFKRPGKNWLDYIGKQVEVTGPTRTKKDQRFIKVDTLTVLKERPASGAAPAASVIGTEVELVLKDLFGVEQRLSSFKGRIVILNFWATYCVPCRKEMPDLARIQNEYAAFGVQVIGAASDPLSDQAKVRQFIKETKVNFPVWLGASADDMRRFGLGSALPGTVVIGRDGKVIAQIRGVIKEADLRKHLDKLLARDESGAQRRIAKAGKTGKASNVPS
ncbi:MAG TPA: TlpA disulfide reductase family protein [Blastocatellia bacterium]|nr:TlpA disulfide reductase family protein [Blastocatellia bacterium]